MRHQLLALAPRIQKRILHQIIQCAVVLPAEQMAAQAKEHVRMILIDPFKPFPFGLFVHPCLPLVFRFLSYSIGSLLASAGQSMTVLAAVTPLCTSLLIFRSVARPATPST